MRRGTLTLKSFLDPLATEVEKKETLFHAGMRPDSPMLTPSARFMEKGELRRIEKLPPA